MTVPLDRSEHLLRQIYFPKTTRILLVSVFMKSPMVVCLSDPAYVIPVVNLNVRTKEEHQGFTN